MITSNLKVKVDLIVYLRTEPSALHERIASRARSEETAIPLEYLQSLHSLHEEWLMEKKFGLPAPVLVLDANQDLPTMYKKFQEFAPEILCRNMLSNTSEMNVSSVPESPVKTPTKKSTAVSN